MQWLSCYGWSRISGAGLGFSLPRGNLCRRQNGLYHAANRPPRKRDGGRLLGTTDPGTDRARIAVPRCLRIGDGNEGVTQVLECESDACDVVAVYDPRTDRRDRDAAGAQRPEAHLALQRFFHIVLDIR